MTDAPEKIRTNAAGNAIVTPHPVWETDVEYIRADVAQAMVAAAYADAAKIAESRITGNGHHHEEDCEAEHIAQDIRARARTDPDALDARDKRVREDALREAANVCFEYSKDHGSGMFDRHSSECASRICALIALTQIEENHT